MSKKSILLSPAAASFDQFINFEKRGEEFKRLCKNMLENSFKFYIYKLLEEYR